MTEGGDGEGFEFGLKTGLVTMPIDPPTDEQRENAAANGWRIMRRRKVGAWEDAEPSTALEDAFFPGLTEQLARLTIREGGGGVSESGGRAMTDNTDLDAIRVRKEAADNTQRLITYARESDIADDPLVIDLTAALVAAESRATAAEAAIEQAWASIDHNCVAYPILAAALPWPPRAALSQEGTEPKRDGVVDRRPHYDFAVAGCDCGGCFGEVVSLD